MRTVDIRIGHDDNLMVAQFVYIKLSADTAANRRNKCSDFAVTQDLVEFGLFDVGDLPLSGRIA